LVAETGLEPASTDYEPVPGGFTTPVYSASNFSNWLRRKDSNLRMTRSRDERRSTWLLRNGISDCQLPIADLRFASGIKFLTPRTNRKSAIKNRKCFWWIWHDLKVRPRPSHSRALIPLSYRSEELAEATGLEPARALRGDLANRCHTVRRRLQNCFSQEKVLAEGTGVESASDKRAVVFGTTALPVRLPFQKRISDCELRICTGPLALRSLRNVGRDARI
jgi:hypothetical protein